MIFQSFVEYRQHEIQKDPNSDGNVARYFLSIRNGVT